MTDGSPDGELGHLLLDGGVGETGVPGDVVELLLPDGEEVRGSGTPGVGSVHPSSSLSCRGSSQLSPEIYQMITPVFIDCVMAIVLRAGVLRWS